MTYGILLSSICLQIIATVLAFHSAYKQQWMNGWLIFSTALFLMTSRRIVSFCSSIAGGTPLNTTAEIIALAISALMCIGICFLTQKSNSNFETLESLNKNLSSFQDLNQVMTQNIEELERKVQELKLPD